MSERKKGPLMRDYRCRDRSTYQYGDVCTDEMRRSKGDLCMTGADQLCHISYPVGDFRKSRSNAAFCRTVPQDYIDGDFDFLGSGSVDSDKGLCVHGCEQFDNNNRCAWSWPRGESQIFNAKAMQRCAPQGY